MRRLLTPLLLALALLAAGAAAAGAQTSPFGRGTPSAPSSTETRPSQTKPADETWLESWYAAYRRWQFDLMRKQRDLNEWLADEIRAYKEDGALRPVLMILLVSFLYGLLHAAGPGHGKIATAAYFGANRAAAVQGVTMSAMIAAIQALSAIVLIGALPVLFKLSHTETVRSGDFVTAASFALIAGVGLWIAWGGVVGRGCTHSHGPPAAHGRGHDHAHDHGHGHDHHAHAHGHDHAHEVPAKPGFASMLPVALASGVRPCTGAILVLLLTLSQGIFEIGVIATLVMAFGTFVVVALIGLGVIYARRAASRAGGRHERLANFAQRGVSLAGGLIVFGFGALFLHTALLQLGFKV